MGNLECRIRLFVLQLHQWSSILGPSNRRPNTTVSPSLIPTTTATVTIGRPPAPSAAVRSFAPQAAIALTLWNHWTELLLAIRAMHLHKAISPRTYASHQPPSVSTRSIMHDAGAEQECRPTGPEGDIQLLRAAILAAAGLLASLLHPPLGRPMSAHSSVTETRSSPVSNLQHLPGAPYTYEKGPGEQAEGERDFLFGHHHITTSRWRHPIFSEAGRESVPISTSSKRRQKGYIWCLIFAAINGYFSQDAARLFSREWHQRDVVRSDLDAISHHQEPPSTKSSIDSAPSQSQPNRPVELLNRANDKSLASRHV
ncbi:hypothetical protein CPLU01_11585 [Colletotrichum plurivorum]|uniref:Uncharacterized protein n=1 Tax=Colletotrichum plurivorum TaxID=2175906 RepID=A0A8H6K1Q7_9PEZI|nr:hypothetical protein CPLU01_11585 [Colletotrichum plurivorum]